MTPDAALVHTSKTQFYKKYVRMPFKEKWKEFPRKFCDREIDTKAIRMLRELNKTRRKLVHFKPFMIEEPLFSSGGDDLKLTLPAEDVRHAIRTVFIVTAALREIHPDWRDYSYYDPNCRLT
jgi:hypothetical protein